MRVTLLQTDSCWADVAGNIRQAERLMAESAGSDLYVLPEMWSTGFMSDPRGIDPDEAAVAWMRRKAAETNAAICGSVATNVFDDRYANRLFFVEPDGKTSTYDKKHLFRYGGEGAYYEAGQRRVVVNFRGWRLLLLVCYDLRYPVWARWRNDYDAIVLVANWPTSRQNVWDTLPRARAIENECYFIGCNRVGDDQTNHYAGHSQIISPKGFTTIESTEEKAEALTADIDLEEVNHLREKFGSLKDSDPFDINF